MQRRGSSKSLKLRHMARWRMSLQSLLRDSIIYSVMLRSCSGAVPAIPETLVSRATKRGKGSDCRRYEGSITRWNFFQKIVVRSLVAQGARLNHSPYSTERCKTISRLRTAAARSIHSGCLRMSKEYGEVETHRALGRRPSPPRPSPVASARSPGSHGSALAWCRRAAEWNNRHTMKAARS
jgi:hypothetical protein